MKKTRLLIVEDDSLVREGLAHFVNKSSEYVCVGAFATAEDALHQFDDLEPDVVLTDIGLPEMDGIQLLKEIKKRILNVPL